MGREIGTFDGDVHTTPDGVLLFSGYKPKVPDIDYGDASYGFCPNTGIAFIVSAEDGSIVRAFDFIDQEWTTESITDNCVESDDFARILVGT
jgi:hypothetical protein